MYLPTRDSPKNISHSTIPWSGFMDPMDRFSRYKLVKVPCFPWDPMKTHEKWKFYSFTPPKYGWVLTPKNEGFPWVPMVEGQIAEIQGKPVFVTCFNVNGWRKKIRVQLAWTFGLVKWCRVPTRWAPDSSYKWSYGAPINGLIIRYPGL